MTRLFVAVWPPEDVVSTLAALPRPYVPGVRWSRRIVPVTHPQPFQADIVLARGRVPSDLAGGLVAASWTADAVFLVADRSSPQGVRFDDLAEFRLGG